MYSFFKFKLLFLINYFFVEKVILIIVNKNMLYTRHSRILKTIFYILTNDTWKRRSIVENRQLHGIRVVRRCTTSDSNTISLPTISGATTTTAQIVHPILGVLQQSVQMVAKRVGRLDCVCVWDCGPHIRMRKRSVLRFTLSINASHSV